MARAHLALLSPSESVGYASKRLFANYKANVTNVCMLFVISKEWQRGIGFGWGTKAQLCTETQCPLSRHSLCSTEEQMGARAPKMLRGPTRAVPAQRPV